VIPSCPLTVTGEEEEEINPKTKKISIKKP
jgi:hypothetical protein